MKVGDLIELLQSLDQDAEIMLTDPDVGIEYEISEVRHGEHGSWYAIL